MTYDKIGTKTWTQEWLGDWGGKLTAAFGAFLIFHVAYVLFHLGSAEGQSLTSNLITLVIGVIFHVLTFFTLEVGAFALYSLVFYVVFVPWERLSHRPLQSAQ